MEVLFCVFDMSTEEEELLEKIKKVFLNLAPEETTIRTIDLAVYSLNPNKDHCIIVFGNKALRVFEVGDLDQAEFNKDVTSLSKMLQGINKEHTFNALKELAEYLKNKTKENETRKYIETDNGITVGPSMCDINISIEEAEHLKKIKDILGGGTIKITKGDLVIEVKQ